MDHAAAPVPVGGLLRVLGHEVRVDVRPGADPALTPLLLLTGLGGNVEMWEPFRSDLAARTGVATIAYDVPGTGESPPPAQPAMNRPTENVSRFWQNTTNACTAAPSLRAGGGASA